MRQSQRTSKAEPDRANRFDALFLQGYQSLINVWAGLRSAMLGEPFLNVEITLNHAFGSRQCAVAQYGPPGTYLLHRFNRDRIPIEDIRNDHLALLKSSSMDLMMETVP